MSRPNSEASALIARLGLQPLPHEGGYFARTWTSRDTLANGRPIGTAIYFLLTPGAFSALHKLDADELWHFHAGDPVEHVQLLVPPTAAQHTLLGPALEAGQLPPTHRARGRLAGRAARTRRFTRLGLGELHHEPRMGRRRLHVGLT
jgi:uncharacterized protein